MNNQGTTYKWKFYRASELEMHRAAWDELNGRCAASLLLGSTFLIHMLGLLGDGNETLAICTKGETVVACTVLVNPKSGVWQTFQPSQAPLGAWISDRNEELISLIRTLQYSLPGFCLVLGILQQDPEFLPRPADAGHVRTLDYIKTARISIYGTFDEYWKRRGKNLRHNIKRQRNLLKKEMIETRIELIYDKEGLSLAVDEYGDLESAGWKLEKGTAINRHNVQGRLYKSILTDFSHSGSALACRYFYNEKLVSTDLCISDNDTLIVLKTTYDESQTSTSPTMLMHHDFFTMLFGEKKYNKIEFYGRLMDWHAKWTDEIRVLYHINNYRWRWLARILSKA